MRFFDAAIDRRQKFADAELDRITLGVNKGTLITYDQAALRRWQSSHRGPQTPAQFTTTVGRLGALFPDKIQH